MMLGKKKHKWLPYGNPIRFMKDGKLYVYIVEFCSKTGMYQYIRVPSNKKRMELERVEE